MKKLFKLFIFVLLVFAFVNQVYADFECDIRVTKKDKLESTDTYSQMPICKTKVQSGFMEVGRKGSYKAAYDSGLELTDIMYEQESADGKDLLTVHGRIPVCNDSKRRVVAYSTCTATRSKALGSAQCVNNFTTAAACNKIRGCSWDASDKACYGTYSYYYCPDGWTPNSAGKCEKAYTYKNEVDGDVNVAAACTSATGGTTCSCSKVEYALECPAYTCETENIKVKTCTSTYELDGETVYCVNPGQHFNIGYEVDSDFNVRQCANSYATQDCGFANILIEGAYHEGTPDSAINLALRLWSYHTSGPGFDDMGKTGVANVTGENCETPTYFMKNGDKRPNVYKETYDYIMRDHKNDYFDKAQDIINKKGYIPAGMEKNTAKLPGNTFKEIACKGTIGVTCDKGVYGQSFELFFNTLFGNKYMMEHLDSLYKEETKKPVPIDITLEETDEGVWVVEKYEEEEFEKAFGPEETIKCDESDPTFIKYRAQIEPYCKVETTYYDKYDNPITLEEYKKICDKQVGCMTLTKEKAICVPETGGQSIVKVEVKDTPPKSGTSVRKLIPCGTDVESQFMFQFIPEEKQGPHDERETTTTTYYMNYLCGNSCDNYEARVDKENSCTAELNKSYKNVVSDPSLSCIVHMSSTEQRDMYDYSSKFGVNTNFCRVYCSDKVEYTLAGRTEAASGRAFKYDVRSDASHQTLKEYALGLSSIVKQRRTCVSEIYFNKLPKNANWKAMYGLTDAENERLMANNTWTTLFNIIVDKSNNATRIKRKENINQLLYDIYNCNLYSKGAITDAGIYRPENYKTAEAWSVILNAFKDNNKYGLEDMSKFSDSVTYEGGANVAEYVNSNDGAITGKLGQDIKVSAKAEVLPTNSGTGIIKFNDKYVNYCKESQGHTCLQYNSNKEDYTYSEFSPTSKTGKSHGYTYPANDYALFVAETETGFYNDHHYQTFEGTGNVIEVSKPGFYEDLLDTPENSYPLSVYAYNECANNECKVTQTINISPFFRARSNDPLQTATKNKAFTCSVKVYPPFTVDSSRIYRNADPSNLFPNGVDSDSNWSSVEGLEAKDQIEKSAHLIETSEDLIDYRITLNPEQIKNIKEYNKKAGAYSKEVIYCNGEQINEDRTNYEGCSSQFLNLMRNENSEHGSGGYGTLDPKFDGTSQYVKDQKNN